MAERPSPTLQRIVDDAVLAIETVEGEWEVKALRRLVVALVQIERECRQERVFACRAIEMVRDGNFEYNKILKKRALIEAYKALHPVDAEVIGL
jgi:hypothetical protein